MAQADSRDTISLPVPAPYRCHITKQDLADCLERRRLLMRSVAAAVALSAIAAMPILIDGVRDPALLVDLKRRVDQFERALEAWRTAVLHADSLL